MEVEEPAKIKKRVIAQSSDEEEDSVPLIKRARVEPSSPVVPAAAAPAPTKVNGHAADTPVNGNSSTSEDDAPLINKVATPQPLSKAASNASSDDEQAPLAATKAPAQKKKLPAKRKKPARQESEELSGSESEAATLKPIKPRKRRPKVDRAEKESAAVIKTEPTSTLANGKAKPKAKPKAKANADGAASDGGSPAPKEGDEDSDAWWLQAEEGDNSVKWNTLSHNGVLFPPPYEPLPSHVKLVYNGNQVELSPEAEEVAGFFAAMLETDHARKPVFQDNFFKDFVAVVKEYPCPDGTKITVFDKCDFKPMADYFEEERARKKTKTKEEKKAEKEAKDKLEEKYKFCVLNGKKEKVGNFRIEPPGLFRGRGAHPKTGRLKTRVEPEQVSINIGEDADVPTPPPGHSWGKVQHDNTVSWLAMWKENINGATKYVFLAAGSSLKGKSDMMKFEKARKLKDYIDQIRLDYNADMSDKVMATRQRATATYLIDKFALRAGNEKGDEEADTVGCCSLKCNNITLTPPTEVLFDFLGKDSIRFLNTFNVDPAVFKNLRIFKKNKDEEDLLFDRLTTGLLNKHLGSYMDGLSAKVFRTYNASWTFQQELEKRTDAEASVADKILAYNRANRDVAILCNHQRAVPKTHENSMNKLVDKLKALKYQRRKLRYALACSQEAAGDDEKYEDYEEDESDIDDEWIAEHETKLRDLAKEKAQKKFDKFKAEEETAVDSPVPVAAGKSDTQKRGKKEEDGFEDEDDKSKVKKGKVFTEEDLEAALEAADEDYQKNVAETASGRVETKKSVAAILKDLGKKDTQIAAHRVLMVDRDEGKEIALGTSKLNYIDPRLTFAWCKKYDVPIEKMFSKTLREKFVWASGVDADWTF